MSTSVTRGYALTAIMKLSTRFTCTVKWVWRKSRVNRLFSNLKFLLWKISSKGKSRGNSKWNAYTFYSTITTIISWLILISSVLCSLSSPHSTFEYFECKKLLFKNHISNAVFFFLFKVISPYNGSGYNILRCLNKKEIVRALVFKSLNFAVYYFE